MYICIYITHHTHVVTHCKHTEIKNASSYNQTCTPLYRGGSMIGVNIRTANADNGRYI